tara:strand:+ start:896 stop:1117 length:222 start_codon:yes stop_codon:yes gene_type:complete
MPKKCANGLSHCFNDIKNFQHPKKNILFLPILWLYKNVIFVQQHVKNSALAKKMRKFNSLGGFGLRNHSLPAT